MIPRTFLLLGLVVQAATAPTGDPAADTRTWRAKREVDLKAERGWLSVSAMPWLKEGETTIGSDEKAGIRVADGPKIWGSFVRTGDRVTVRPAGEPERPLTSADRPFQIGRTWVQFLKRSDLIGLRLWDPQNARKLAFKGLEWFEVNPAYRVQGHLVPAATPPAVKIANVLGQVNDYPSPGVVEFELNGRKLRLTPVFETPAKDELFYIFKDATAGKSTYGAGRFVYSALPDAAGNVILDFNRAYSPPCAFTDFATCPLPPAENRLAVPIEAGEKDPHRAH
jgi:uncharacterized protein